MRTRWIGWARSIATWLWLLTGISAFLVPGHALAGDRPDIWTFTPVQRADLFTQMSNYITKTVIEEHICPPLNKHGSARFMVWHRAYIKGMEDYLISQNRPQFVPLPKWDPSTCIPTEFLLGGGVDADCSLVAACGADATNCDPLVNSCPAVAMLASLSTNLCNQTNFSSFRSTLENSYHNGVHGAIGGVMGTYESPAAPIFWLWHAHVDDIWCDWECMCGLDEGGAFSSYTATEIITDLRPGVADAWTRDSDADIANEPNNETGAVLWASKDIWVRNAAATPVGTRRYLNEHQHENPEYAAIPANRPYIYVKVRNRGCTTISGDLHVYWANASTGLTWPTNFTEVTTSPVTITGLSAGQEHVGQFHWLNIPVPGGSAGSHFCLVSRFVATPASADPINGELNNVSVGQNVKNSNQIAWKNVTIVDNILNNFQVLVRNISTNGNFLRLAFSVPPDALQDSIFDHASAAIDLGPVLFGRWIQNGGQGNGIAVDPNGMIRILGPDATIDGLPMMFQEQFLVNMRFGPGPDPCENETSVFDLHLTAYEGQTVLGGNTYEYGPSTNLPSPAVRIDAIDPRTNCSGSAVRLQVSTQLPAGTTRQWYRDGAPIPNATGTVYSATASGEYTMQAAYANGCSRFSQEINVYIGLPPVNDDPCSATLLGLNQPVLFENACATAQPGEVTPGVGTGSFGGCQSGDGWCLRDPAVQNSMWYRFIAPASGMVSIHVNSIHHMEANTQIAVYRASNCSNYGSYQRIGANDDSGNHGEFGTDPELHHLSVIPGTDYLIQLDGYQGSTGVGTLVIEDPGARVVQFGSPGIGSNGPVLLSGIGVPDIGTSFALLISNGRPNTVAAFIIGIGAISVPIFPQLTLYTIPQISIVQFTDPTGTSALPIDIPHDPFLSGASVVAQAVLRDPPVPGGWVGTNGLILVIL